MDPEDGRNDGLCVGNGNEKGSGKRSVKEEKEEHKVNSRKFLIIYKLSKIRYYCGICHLS